MGDMVPPELEDGEIEDSPPRGGRSVIVGLAAAPRPGKEAALIEGTPAAPELSGGNAGAQHLPITRWNKILQVVPANKTRALFPGGDQSSSQQHLDGRQCSDPGFMALIRRRYQELFGEFLNPARVPAFLAKLGYAEHFLKLELDYPEILVSRERTLERRNERMRQKGDPPTETALKTRQTIAKRLASNVPRRARSRPSSLTTSLITKQLKAVQKELQVMRTKWQETEARAARAERVISSERFKTMQKIGLVPASLEELHGEPLEVSMHAASQGSGGAARNINNNNNNNNNNKDKECPVCFQLFTSEGLYQLGCGHEYHVQCLLLHAFCICSCAVCNAQIPREFYVTFGQEDMMPEPEVQPPPPPPPPPAEAGL